MFVPLTTWEYGERVPTAVNIEQIRHIYEAYGETLVVFSEQHKIAVVESLEKIEQIVRWIKEGRMGSEHNEYVSKQAVTDCLGGERITSPDMALADFPEATAPAEEDDVDNSGEWVPISELLPWKSDVYLVVVTPPNIERQVGVCYYDQDEQRFTSVGWNSWQRYGFVDPTCITHWQELPKLPEVNSDGR